MLFGAIGYSILEHSEIFSDIKIILISDKHDEEDKICKSYDGKIVDSIMISDYLKKLIGKNYILLLEEIPYGGELVSLWNDSDHVINTRKLYLESLNNEKLKNKIIPFDIRLDLISNMSNEYYLNQILRKYIINITNFCLLKCPIFKEFKIYENIDKSFISSYYREILDKFYFCTKYYEKYLDYKIKDIPHYNNIIDTIELLLSDIMEFYCILKICDLIDRNNKKLVIYCGLYHIEKIKDKLINYFKFRKIYDRGIMKMADIEKINQTCSDIPINV
jgi:hypothetical protein